jgi:hypothetical protein
VALGVVALYSLVIVVGSFYVKKHIGQKAWRLIHFVSLGVFLASLVHGITAGTDTQTPLMLGLYLGSAFAVAALVGFRLTGHQEPTHARSRPTEGHGADGPEQKGLPALDR